MKTYTEIEKLADEVYPHTDMGKLKSHIGFINGYTKCQEDMADNWIKVEDIEKGFEQFYPNGEKCEFTAHAAAQICEVIFKNKINKQD